MATVLVEWEHVEYNESDAMRFLYAFTLSKFLLLIFLFSGFVLLGVAAAHGTGASLEKMVGEYKVDIGYDPPVLEAKDPIYFDFTLLSETGERAEFSDIWVRVMKGKQTAFATGIHKPSFGNSTMIYMFPEGGEYELKVRFQNEGEALAEASFPLAVEKAATGAGFPGFIWLAAGLFGGAIAGFLVGFAGKRKKRAK